MAICFYVTSVSAEVTKIDQSLGGVVVKIQVFSTLKLEFQRLNSSLPLETNPP